MKELEIQNFTRYKNDPHLLGINFALICQDVKVMNTNLSKNNAFCSNSDCKRGLTITI